MKAIKIIPFLAIFVILSFSYSQTTEKESGTFNSSSHDQLMAYVFNEIDYEYKNITTKDLESSVQIYFLGGCGYFISGGGKNILIDALYKHPHPKFPNVRTPEDAYKKMLSGEPPFQRIDLILVSHYHADHFTTDRGFPVLIEHPETRMIANQYTLSLAKEDDPENYERVKNQIIQKDLEWGKIKEISLDGFPIKAYLVKHTTGDHLDREYIVTQFLLELEGLKMLHMGDMYTPPNMEYFKKFGLEKEHIDLVFHAGGIDDTVKILMNEYIQPKFFVVMHNRFYEEGQYYRSFLDIFPNATIFLKPMERKIFLKKDFPKLTGPYLGQEPPASEPVLFAPGIVSYGKNHSSVAINPDGKELYWSGVKRKIWFTELEDGKWTEPELVSFCKEDPYEYDNPFISPDGNKMFFTSFRPGAVSQEKETIWYLERTSSGWSDPKPVNSEVNETPLHWSISVSDSGTLYFQFQDASGKSPGGIGDIYYSKLVNNEYQKPVSIGSAINTPATETCPHIAPDESYIVFTRFDETNVKNTGIFISYKDKSGNWLPAVMAEGGTKEKGGLSPRISPDGKYLFYVNGGMWWMPAKFIEQLRPGNL